MNKESTINTDTIDIRSLVMNYMRYWYYFLLSIIAFIFIAFLINRYTPPEYSVHTKLLIRDDSNTKLGAENLLEELEIFSGRTNLKNEIVILKSYTIAKKIVEELELGVSYYQHGFFQKNEVVFGKEKK